MLAVEAHHWYIIAFTPWHKLWKRSPLFTVEGPTEFKGLIDTINPLVKGEWKDPENKQHQNFDEKPNLRMDNHFSGDATSQEVGEKG